MLKLNIQNSSLFVIVLLLGVTFRYLCGLRSPNFDFHSWEIVADLFLANKSIYLNTTRYNYGPVWFNIIGFFRYINLDFRVCIISFLTFIDAVIFLLIWKMNRVKESVLFFLCPISIIISGYHHQFENFSILTLFIGIYYIIDKYGNGVDFDSISFNDTIILGLIMGFSFAIKHIFILLPLWLFFQTHQFHKRIFILIVPIAIFIASFIFYWKESKEGIVNNVFEYSSYNNYPFYQILYADLFDFLNKWNDKFSRILFFIIIIVMGFVFRRRNILDTFLLYSASFVCFSSAVTSSYLVIPVIYISFYFYSSALFYCLIGGLIMVFLDTDGLRFLTSIPQYSYLEGKLWYKIMIGLLFMNIISSIKKRDYLLDFISYSYAKAKQLSNEIIEEIRIFLKLVRF